MQQTTAGDGVEAGWLQRGDGVFGAEAEGIVAAEDHAVEAEGGGAGESSWRPMPRASMSTILLAGSNDSGPRWRLNVAPT